MEDDDNNTVYNEYSKLEENKESGVELLDGGDDFHEKTTKAGLCWFKFVNCFDYFRKGKKKLTDESFGEEVPDEVSEQEAKSLKDSIIIISLLIIALVALGMALIYLDFVLVPLVMAWFLVYLFQPFINFLVGKKAILHDKIRIRLPRLFAVTIVALIVILIICLVGVAIYFSIKDLIDNSDKYIERIEEIKGQILNWAAEYGFEDKIEELIPRINVGDIFLSFMAQATIFVPQAFLCILFTIYMLIDYDETKDKTELERNIDQQIRKYIILKIVLSIITTTMIAIVYASLSLDMWVLFAFLTFFLNFIPNVGCMVAIVLPLPIVLLDEDQTWWSATLIFLLPIIIHFIAGNFIEPHVMGKSMDMSAISVLVTLSIWGSIWGIIGAFIAVPLTVVCYLWLRTIPHPMALFMSNLIAGKFRFVEVRKKYQ